MKVSSPRFKALTVVAGFSVWFIIITLSLGIFSFVIFGIFLVVSIMFTQVFAVKLSNALNSFAMFNTKLFLGILFVTIISLYGIFFKILKIDLLRLKDQSDTYWLNNESSKNFRKQF